MRLESEAEIKGDLRFYTAKRLWNTAQGCRFAATLGVCEHSDSNPDGVAFPFVQKVVQPLWGYIGIELNPRVAARRGNPGLCCITASPVRKSLVK